MDHQGDEQRSNTDDETAERTSIDVGQEAERLAHVEGLDVQVGPELTDRPRAGSTEPPD